MQGWEVQPHDGYGLRGPSRRHNAVFSEGIVRVVGTFGLPGLHSLGILPWWPGTATTRRRVHFMAYAHKNSKGDTYLLHSKDVTLRNGRQQRIFFFARAEKPGESLDAVPEGYSVGENQRTGLPFLTKKKPQ